MSRFYQELHDRELLLQAEEILRELQRRQLIDVFLASSDAAEEERLRDIIFPRRLSSMHVENGRLLLSVERSFFAVKGGISGSTVSS